MHTAPAVVAPSGRTTGRVFVLEVPPSRETSFASEVARGLGAQQKTLPSRFFYDERGSRLFERITALPEYYLTRCEEEIVSRRSREIVAQMPTELSIVELGSGSSTKTRHILRAALAAQRHTVYTPIDISAKFLRRCAHALVAEMPRLQIAAIAGEYVDALHTLSPSHTPRLFLFLGSNIGNYCPGEARETLQRISSAMSGRDRLLVGIDLAKQPKTIEAAYNDAAGVTAQFNKNLLSRINKELDGRFNVDAFDHHAPYVPSLSRVEMRLVSTKRQSVRVGGIQKRFQFEEGEWILTEVSTKHSLPAFNDICESAGLVKQAIWCDDKGYFADVLLARR